MPFKNQLPRRPSAERDVLSSRCQTTDRPARRRGRQRLLAHLGGWRRWLAAMAAAATANIAVGLVSCAVLDRAVGAELNADHAGAIGASYAAALGAERPRAHVQPRAWEFAPPYGKPDLSDEKARVVDQLYDHLMHGILSDCSRRAATAAREDRC
jgi:hypothetical protein